MKCIHQDSFINKKSFSNHKRWCEKLIKKGKKGINKGDSNGLWKGDKVSYRGLHKWVERNLPREVSCRKCNRMDSRLEVGNISLKYKRELSDWLWVCHPCNIDMGSRNPIFGRISTSKSGHKGVNWFSPRKRWRVFIPLNGKDKYIGSYKNIEEAIKARKEAENDYYIYSLPS